MLKIKNINVKLKSQNTQGIIYNFFKISRAMVVPRVIKHENSYRKYNDKL